MALEAKSNIRVSSLLISTFTFLIKALEIYLFYQINSKKRTEVRFLTKSP